MGNQRFKFNRIWSLTLARPKPDAFFGTQANAIVITELRVVFSIEKTLESKPNTCEINVYNLAERTRAVVQEKPLHVILEAGYDGEAQRIFTGDARWVISRREGTDWQTRIELGDGERAYRFARVNRTFRAGVDVKTVVGEAAKSMGLSLPKNLDDVREMSSQFATGVTLQGPSHKELTRILGARGFDWSIQDGRLQALRERDVRSDQAYLISEDTGMIGSPEFGAPKEAGKPPVLAVRTLLAPRITPGGRIKVEAAATRGRGSGVFKVQRVVHQGDSHGPDWYTDIEATPV